MKLFTTERKLKISLLSMFLITAGFIVAGIFPTLNDPYFVYVFGILTAAGIHHGANVMNKSVLIKSEVLKPVPEELP